MAETSYEKYLSNTKLLVGFFVLASLLIYAPAYHAGYSSDYFGYLDAYKKNEWMDILLTFHYGSLLYVLHYVTYFIVHYFGPENIFFFLIASIFHGFNSYLTGVFARKLFNIMNLEVGMIAIGASLLYLVNPYLSEGLTWKACLHYPMVVTFILCALIKYCDFLIEGRASLRWQAILFFIISCFTLEFGMFVPGIFALLLFLKAYMEKSWTLVKKEALWTWIPSGAFLGFYLLMNKLILGVFIGHYKAASHLAFGFHSLTYVVKAFIKTLLFARHWPHTIKMSFYEVFLNKPVNTLACLFLIIGIVFILLNKNSSKLILGFFLLCGFALFFAPVCNSYFVMLSWFEVDRYVFISLTFFVILYMLLISVFPKWIQISLFGIFFCISSYFLTMQIKMLGDSAVSSTRIMDSGSELYKSSKNFILLNVPDSYNGFWMYTNFSDDVPALTEGLSLLRDSEMDIRKNKRLLAFVMLNANDSFNIERIETNKWKMSMGQWGSWWIKNGVGTTGFENDSMKVEIDNIQAVITLKKDMKNLDFWLMNKSILTKVNGMKYEEPSLPKME